MAVNSLLADMIATLKNGQMAMRKFVNVRKSKLNMSVLTVLRDQGYIEDFAVEENGKFSVIKVFLRYYERNPVISMIKIVSKPGCRCYISRNDIKNHRVWSGLGVAIMSTSLGVMTEADAYRNGVGGEMLCKVF